MRGETPDTSKYADILFSLGCGILTMPELVLVQSECCLGWCIGLATKCHSGPSQSTERQYLGHRRQCIAPRDGIVWVQYPFMEFEYAWADNANDEDFIAE